MKNVLSLISDFKKEIDEIIKSKLESYLSNMNLVTIEEYEILNEKIAELTIVNKKLDRRILDLEKRSLDNVN